MICSWTAQATVGDNVNRMTCCMAIDAPHWAKLIAPTRTVNSSHQVRSRPEMKSASAARAKTESSCFSTASCPTT